MRVAFTIVYNGLHHFHHLGFTQKMLQLFDKWYIIEGLSKNGGSTNWCENLDLPYNSTDGTCEFLTNLSSENEKVTYIKSSDYWKSKDEQVNAFIPLLQKEVKDCYLWQVDVDEHWKEEDLKTAEHRLSLSGYKQAEFQFNHYVGKNKIAIGEWGSGFVTRLFIWEGQRFQSHEPAALEGIKDKIKLEGLKFDHYSYYFIEDIQFKEKYYGTGYEGLQKRWERLQYIDGIKIPITALFSHRSQIGKSKSHIRQLWR